MKVRGLLTRYTPTIRLAIVVAAMAPLWICSAWPNGAIVPIVGLAALCVVVAVDVILTPSERTVDVARSYAAAIGVGDAALLVYTVTSSVGRRLRVAIFDALPQALEFPKDARTVQVPPHGSVHAEVEIVGRTRGTHQLGVVTARVLGPLGLVHRTLTYDFNDQIVVIPSVAGVRGHHLRALQYRTRSVGARSLRLRGNSTTFARLRDYTQGDDPRHIDWKATARRERLTSREFSIEQGQTVMIAVDAGRMMTQMAGDRPRFEYALSAALMLADVALASGDLVGLLVFDEEIRAYLAPARGDRARRDLRGALTAAEARMVEPDYAGAFRTLATRQRRRSLVVLFTDVIDPRSSSALIAHTVHSAQRHLPLVVALHNEQLAAASVPASNSPLDALYDAVAAEELLRSRADALERMRRRGVSVLDTAPLAMPAAVINRYLELKDRAAL